MSSLWEGLFCALWTPTDACGRLLDNDLQSNLDFLKARGVQGLLPLGSTGEFLRLDLAQRKHVMQRVADLARPLPLMMNISDIRPAVVAELGAFARQIGARAVSVLPPYFFPLAQEDLIEFFVRASEAAQLPLFLYNFPERTGNRIALETIAAVADRVPVAGVKQSGSEFSYHAALVELGLKKDFVVLTGADTRVPEALAMGVRGCVSGLSNAVPELVRAALCPDPEGAPGLSQLAAERMAELGRLIPAVHFPMDVAAVMEARGLPVGHPKIIVSASTQTKYQRLVGQLRELLAEWKLI